MNVIDHIKEEHKIFREKIAEIEKADGNMKKELFTELYALIHGHHEAEEKVVFPKIKEKVDKEELEIVLEMIEEHAVGTYQFSVLEKLPVKDETWDAKFSVLKEILDHHMEEEEAELLPLADKLLPKSTLAEILDKFETVNETKMREQKKKLEA